MYFNIYNDAYTYILACFAYYNYMRFFLKLQAYIQN
jgi:hypothetical protein